MKQCIFCMEWKEDKEFNREHIILEALGGKCDKDICLNVCTSCNSSLGTRVDASLLNQSITKYMRYKFKIRGKNGIPNPFKGIEVKYADTSIAVSYTHLEVCTGAAIIPAGERLVPSWPGAFQKQHGKLGNPLQRGVVRTCLLEDP